MPSLDNFIPSVVTFLPSLNTFISPRCTFLLLSQWCFHTFISFPTSSSSFPSSSSSSSCHYEVEVEVECQRRLVEIDRIVRVEANDHAEVEVNIVLETEPWLHCCNEDLVEDKSTSFLNVHQVN